MFPNDAMHAPVLQRDGSLNAVARFAGLEYGPRDRAWVRAQAASAQRSKTLRSRFDPWWAPILAYFSRR
jgi:hypothetical protein